MGALTHAFGKVIEAAALTMLIVVATSGVIALFSANLNFVNAFFYLWEPWRLAVIFLVALALCLGWAQLRRGRARRNPPTRPT